jgi:hypothetical protein
MGTLAPGQLLPASSSRGNVVGADNDRTCPRPDAPSQRLRTAYTQPPAITPNDGGGGGGCGGAARRHPRLCGARAGPGNPARPARRAAQSRRAALHSLPQSPVGSPLRLGSARSRSIWPSRQRRSPSTATCCSSARRRPPTLFGRTRLPRTRALWPSRHFISASQCC